MELNEDKILDFLDGGLTSAEEEELLHRLAVSPERRVVLKQHLQLRELSAILAKKHNYVVPKVLTAQLFTNLSANGYAGPMYHAATDTDALRSSLESNVGRSAEKVIQEGRGFRSTSLIFSSVLSFIAGAILVYFLISSPSQTATGGMASTTSLVEPQNASALNVTSLHPEKSTSAVPSVQDAMTAHTVGTQHDVEQANFIDAISSDEIKNAVDIDHSRNVFTSIDRSVQLGTLPAAIFKGAEVDGESYNTSSNNFAAIDHYEDRSEVAVSSEGNLSLDDIGYSEGKNWWAGDGLYATLDNIRQGKGFFGIDEVEDTVPLIKRTMVSLRSGGGKAPGRIQDYTGSLVELKLSADIGDWLVAKLSFGQFMPYETEALSIGKNGDGVRMLKLTPVLQYRSVVGAELGFRANVFGATVEAMGGFLSDLRNGFIPRAGVFTTLMLQNNLSLQVGVEGVLYTHDIRPSLVNKQMIFAVENPVLTNAMKETETAGFIGPALELAWHF